jgi:hypothetical protein
MIPTVQITGEPDLHPEKPVHDAYELASGQIDISKLKAKGHCARVFNLMIEEDRKKYEELYVELMNKAREGKILISSNVREVLHNSDGSTGWYKFIEWTEFDTSEILGA